MSMGNDVGLRSERGPVLLAIMLSTGLVAIDATILATAVPTIVADLGGFTQFPWLFSIYLLAQSVSTPVVAKLADQFGRKPVILAGIGIFLAGSVLCGFAWSMPALIVARAVQGLGAGGVQPVSVTITGDIYTVAERARVQGYVSGVWAVASVVGPTLGGVFSQFLSWRAIFFVNVPLCLLAAWMLHRRLHENVERRRVRVDYTGTALLSAALTLLILATLEGGQAWAWDSWPSITVFALGAALLVAFARGQRRAEEPVLPWWLFSRRLLGTTTLVSLGVGATLIGLTSYVPTYLEGTTGATPLLSGLGLAALTIGWPLSSSRSGKLYLRFGFRATVLVGVVVTALGVTMLVLVAPHPNLLTVAGGCFVTGMGLGLCAAPALIAAQSSVEWEERGVVTGTNLFARSLGSAVGVAVFGAIANATLRGGTDPVELATATRHVFLAVLACVAVMLVAGLAMPRRTAPRS